MKKKHTGKRIPREKWKRKESHFWLGVAVVLTLLLLIASYAAYKAHSRAESLSGELTLVKSQLTYLQVEVQNLTVSLESALQKIQKQQETIALLEENNTQLMKNLNKTSEELELTKSELEKKNEQLSALKEDINKTLEELEEYERRLTERMSWFKENSNIGLFDDYYTFEKALRGKCLQTSHGVCRINLACLSFVNTYDKDLSYKSDEETSKESDVIQNLESILANKGGDCEDFSLLFMAELNYLKDYCASVDSSKLELIGFVPGSGVFYVENSRTYYLMDAKENKLPENYTYYYITCGNFPEAPNVESTGVVGHCVVAFSDEPILLSENVYRSLSKAVLVEPQTGEILYDLRNSSEMFVPSNSSYEKRYFLYLVITDKDAYEFNENSGNWKGFGDFLDFITKQEEKLNPNSFIS